MCAFNKAELDSFKFCLVLLRLFVNIFKFMNECVCVNKVELDCFKFILVLLRLFIFLTFHLNFYLLCDECFVYHG